MTGHGFLPNKGGNGAGRKRLVLARTLVYHILYSMSTLEVGWVQRAARGLLPAQSGSARSRLRGSLGRGVVALATYGPCWPPGRGWLAVRGVPLRLLLCRWRRAWVRHQSGRSTRAPAEPHGEAVAYHSRGSRSAPWDGEREPPPTPNGVASMADALPSMDKTPTGYACRACGNSRRALRDAGLWDATPLASLFERTTVGPCPAATRVPGTAGKGPLVGSRGPDVACAVSIGTGGTPVAPGVKPSPGSRQTVVHRRRARVGVRRGGKARGWLGRGVVALATCGKARRAIAYPAGVLSIARRGRRHGCNAVGVGVVVRPCHPSMRCAMLGLGMRRLGREGSVNRPGYWAAASAGGTVTSSGSAQ
jgi:hypothetical protein